MGGRVFWEAFPAPPVDETLELMLLPSNTYPIMTVSVLKKSSRSLQESAATHVTVLLVSANTAKE